MLGVHIHTIRRVISLNSSVTRLCIVLGAIAFLILFSACDAKITKNGDGEAQIPEAGADNVNFPNSLILNAPENQPLSESPSPIPKTPKKDLPPEKKPKTEIVDLTSLTEESWRTLVESTINIPQQTILNNTVFLLRDTDSTVVFWKSRNHLVSLTFESTEIINDNPFLLQVIKEKPSDLKENENAILDIAPLHESEKALYLSQYIKTKEAFPYIITEPINDFIFKSATLSEEKGKYFVTYVHDDKEIVMLLYDIVKFKNGRYDDINPDEIFGTEEIKIAKMPAYKDEVSVYWRSQNRIFDFPLPQEGIEAILPLLEAYMAKFPTGGY